MAHGDAPQRCASLQDLTRRRATTEQKASRRAASLTEELLPTPVVARRSLAPRAPLARALSTLHELFERTAEFCAKYDGAAFMQDYDTLPLSFFEPMLRRVMAKPKRSLYKNKLDADQQEQPPLLCGRQPCLLARRGGGGRGSP